MEKIERVGVGRRAEDGHCDNHEEHTKLLSALTANNRLLIIMVPLILSICSGIVAYYVNNMDKSMTRLSDSVAQVQATVNRVITVSAVTDQRLLNLEYHAERTKERR